VDTKVGAKKMLMQLKQHRLIIALFKLPSQICNSKSF